MKDRQLKISKLASTFIACCVTFSLVSAQNNGGDVILNAMQDEISRGMKELKLPDLSAPCYIMYGLQDQKVYVVSGTLGSISQYLETPSRFKSNTRVLVGDFKFNDESMDDNHNSNSSVHEIELPIEDDYYGLRRSFWSGTDQVYRDAARHFEKHKQTLKESGKELSDVPHRAFVKSEPVKVIVDYTPYKWDKEKHTALVRSLSAKFNGHPEITDSGVLLRFLEGQKYIVTSEGTMARVPFGGASISVVAGKKLESGEYVYDQVTFEARTPDDLPEEKKLLMVVDKFIHDFKNPKEQVTIDEEYSGPVLFTGASVMELFANNFVHGQDNFKSNDNIPKMNVYQYQQTGSKESKIGKVFANESLTIKAKPKLKVFNGVELLGSYQIDEEGMVPADEVSLVEKGILKTLLNDRTTTSVNSHNTFALGFSNGPGVLEITSSLKDTDAALKAKLLKKAKDAGLTYAIVVRNKVTGGIGGTNIYKVSVADGKEELVKNLRLDRPSSKSLRKMLGASSEYSAYNVMNYRNEGLQVTSMIVPNAVLLEEVELKTYNAPIVKEEDYVPSPLNAINE